MHLLNRVTFEPGDVGVFRVDGEYTCKKLVQNSDGSIQLESFNPKYEPIKISEFTEIEAQGKVLLDKWRNQF